MYISSLFISLFALIMTIISAFAEEESDIFKVWGNTETWFCIGVSIVLLAIGLIVDKRRDKEIENVDY